MATSRKVLPKQVHSERVGSKQGHAEQGNRERVHPEQVHRERGVAVVTGGAGSIGTIICIALAREGMRVVVGYNRSAEKAKTLAASLPGGGHAALAAPVTDRAALAALA